MLGFVCFIEEFVESRLLGITRVYQTTLTARVQDPSNSGAIAGTVCDISSVHRWVSDSECP